MESYLEKTCACLVLAGEREGCQSFSPGGRRRGPVWVQAPVR